MSSCLTFDVFLEIKIKIVEGVGQNRLSDTHSQCKFACMCARPYANMRMLP